MGVLGVSLGIGAIFLAQAFSNLRKCIESHQEHLGTHDEAIDQLRAQVADLGTQLSNKPAAPRAKKPTAKAPAKPKVTKKATPEEIAAFEAERQRILTTKDFYDDDDDEPTP